MTQAPAADIVEQATDEEMRASIQEHPDVHPDILRLAISLASDRGGATVPVSEYDIRHARDMIAGEQSEISRLQSQIEALRRKIDAAEKALEKHQSYCTIYEGRVVSKYGPHDSEAFLEGAAALASIRGETD